MYKVAWIARYTKERSKLEASDYWIGHHGPLVKQVSPLAGYIQSHQPRPRLTGEAGTR